MGNLAIACPGKMTIESMDHGNEALAQPGRDRPGAWNGTSRMAIKAATKSQQAGYAKQDVVVQRNESGHRRAGAHSAQPQAVRAVAVLQDDMTAVRPLNGNHAW